MSHDVIMSNAVMYFNDVIMMSCCHVILQKEESHDWPLLLAAEHGHLDIVKHLHEVLYM